MEHGAFAARDVNKFTLKKLTHDVNKLAYILGRTDIWVFEILKKERAT